MAEQRAAEDARRKAEEVNKLIYLLTYFIPMTWAHSTSRYSCEMSKLNIFLGALRNKNIQKIH